MNPSRLALFAGPLLALSMTMLLRFQFEWEANAAITLGVTLLCVVWWIFEPIPIPATSLEPLAVLPLLGVITEDDVALDYDNPLAFLLMGGFLLSTALARSGAHRRLPGDGPPDRWLARGLTYKGRFELPQMGAGSTHEKRVLIVFGLTELTWITRGEPFGGWSNLV